MKQKLALRLLKGGKFPEKKIPTKMTNNEKIRQDVLQLSKLIADLYRELGR